MNMPVNVLTISRKRNIFINKRLRGSQMKL